MNSGPTNKQLMEFFLEFGAINGLDEAHIEKLERILHAVRPGSFSHAKRICGDIIKHQLQDLPEDEIIGYLKEEKLI